MQRKTLGQHMKDVFGPIIVRYVVTVLVELIFISFIGMDNLLKYAVEIGGLASLITIFFLVRMTKKDKIREKELGFVFDKTVSYGKYIFLIIMSIAVTIGLNNILLLANIAQTSVEYQESAELMYSASLPVQFLALGIIYPIMEEYMFRGLIYRRIRYYSPKFVAIISSAIFFGIYHGNSVQMIYGMLSGIMLGYFYETYGSLKASALAHIVMNMTSLILTELDAFTWMFHQPVRMGVITVLCAAVGSSMFLFIRKIEEKDCICEASDI